MNATRIYELLASALKHAERASERTRRMVAAAIAAFQSALMIARAAA